MRARTFQASLLPAPREEGFFLILTCLRPQATRRRLLCAALAMLPMRSMAQPSAADWIIGKIARLDPEGGRISIQHAGIAHLHLPAGTTTFRYLETRWINGRRPGDHVRFRADRIDLELRLIALVYIPG